MSRKYKLFQVDSFTDTAFRGNPAGVVLDADGLTDQQMQQIARELNNSETVFILSPTASDHEVWLRYFTPAMGINEDPVTGNGNGPLGAYMIHNNLVEHDGKNFKFRGEQGVSMGRQGFVDVSVEIEDGEPVKVIIGGKAVTVFQTEIEI